jgi:hypothetical protein
VPDEPSNGELARRLEAGFLDLKDDMRDLGKRLDGKVDASYLALQEKAQNEREARRDERITAIEQAREKEAEQKQREQREREAQRAADRRLILTGLIVPVVLVLLQVYLSAKGASG